jgi:thioester reductase-like protein
VAEHFVRQAAARGIDVRIYRPGMVAPHTRTGASNPDDYLNR